MRIQHYILATAGHVDHGKSSLVKALTGTDPDRLPEEKNRGITIDLGFAHLELPAPAGCVREPGAPVELIHFRIGIIDVPGHEDFVRNMVAGVGSIDMALFIVAADDGWMPQTEEHLQILSYLGVKRAVVALTKIDLVSGSEEKAKASVRAALQGSPFETATIVATSVVTGHGLQELKLEIATVLGSGALPRDSGKARLPVDRVFTLRGMGTIVTGTLSGGTLRKGQTVVIQPSGISTRIRSIQSFNREVESSPPGSRTALNLPDLESGDKTGQSKVARGEVVTIGELGGASTVIGALLKRSERLRQTKSAAANPLKHGTRLKVHLGSGHVVARVHFFDFTALEAGEKAVALLRCETPLFGLVGDAFVLRDWPEQFTLGGGIILDAETPADLAASGAEREFLEQRAAGPNDLEVLVRSQLQRDRAVLSERLLARSRFSREEVHQQVQELSAQGVVLMAGGWVLAGEHWKSMQQAAAELIDGAHRTSPQLAGISLNELRAAMEPKLERPELFSVLMDSLGREGFRQSGAYVGRVSHRPELPPQLRAAGQRLREVLASKAFDPPSKKELAADSAAQQALRFLVQSGEVIEVSDEVVLLAENAGKAVHVIQEYLRRHGAGTVSELRQALGASRRIVVPFLERLDRLGITRRDGDKRVLK